MIPTQILFSLLPLIPLAFAAPLPSPAPAPDASPLDIGSVSELIPGASGDSAFYNDNGNGNGYGYGYSNGRYQFDSAIRAAAVPGQENVGLCGPAGEKVCLIVCFSVCLTVCLFVFW